MKKLLVAIIAVSFALSTAAIGYSEKTTSTSKTDTSKGKGKGKSKGGDKDKAKGGDDKGGKRASFK
jgi:Ni/Co efflux regulator RcnB